MNNLLKSVMGAGEGLMKNEELRGWLGTAAMGAGIGGASSWMTGGSVGQGAFMGATAGVGIRGGIGALRSTSRSLTESMASMGIGEMANAFSTSQSRQMAGIGGAALGGFAFGGNRSLSSGFNSNRGNRINH